MKVTVIGAADSVGAPAALSKEADSLQRVRSVCCRYLSRSTLMN